MRDGAGGTLTTVLAWLVVLVPVAGIVAVLGFAIWLRSHSALGTSGAVFFGVALAAWAAWLIARRNRS